MPRKTALITGVTGQDGSYLTDFLIKKGYNQINFIGHSRGGLNVMQALSIIDNKKIKSYLLAPVIDTYKGTKAYYEEELGIPYDLIINSNENYNLADRYRRINFLFCENVIVSSKTFKSYLDFSPSPNMLLFADLPFLYIFFPKL